MLNDCLTVIEMAIAVNIVTALKIEADKPAIKAKTHNKIMGFDDCKISPYLQSKSTWLEQVIF